MRLPYPPEIPPLTDKVRDNLLNRPEVYWVVTFCHKCSANISHPRGFDKADARSYWCEPCLAKEMRVKDPTPTPASNISRDEYDRLMREMQEEESVLPTGVVRSATFSVCQGVVSKPSKTPKLTLKVQK